MVFYWMNYFSFYEFLGDFEFLVLGVFGRVDFYLIELRFLLGVGVKALDFECNF